MKPAESVAQFEEAVEAAGFSIPDLVPRDGLEQMLSFYARKPADDCRGPSADMLLFEWGTYNWGEGESFEVAISRQFMERGAEGEPEVSQLRLVFNYPPDDELTALGEGNLWCKSSSDRLEFAAAVQAGSPFRAVADKEAPAVRLVHYYV